MKPYVKIENGVQTDVVYSVDAPVMQNWYLAPSGFTSAHRCTVENGQVRLMTDAEIEAHKLKVSEAYAFEKSRVSARRFTNELLGLMVYGGLLTALDGLRAKFAAGNASKKDMQYQTILNAADRLVQQGSISLLDPTVGMVLDIAVEIDAVPFTTEDKERVLANVGLDEL